MCRRDCEQDPCIVCTLQLLISSLRAELPTSMTCPTFGLCFRFWRWSEYAVLLAYFRVTCCLNMKVSLEDQKTKWRIKEESAEFLSCDQITNQIIGGGRRASGASTGEKPPESNAQCPIFTSLLRVISAAAHVMFLESCFCYQSCNHVKVRQKLVQMWSVQKRIEYFPWSTPNLEGGGSHCEKNKKWAIYFSHSHPWTCTIGSLRTWGIRSTLGLSMSMLREPAPLPACFGKKLALACANVHLAFAEPCL